MPKRGNACMVRCGVCRGTTHLELGLHDKVLVLSTRRLVVAAVVQAHIVCGAARSSRPAVMPRGDVVGRVNEVSM